MASASSVRLQKHTSRKLISIFLLREQIHLVHGCFTTDLLKMESKIAKLPRLPTRGVTVTKTYTTVVTSLNGKVSMPFE